MKSFAPLLLASLTMTTMANAAFIPGPITHERTDTPKKANAHVGRYLYVGNAPKFAAGEVDLVVSKLGLTLRATGWITQERIDTYASQLYKRWEQIDQTMQDPRFVLHPLVKFQDIAVKESTVTWAKIASQYSSHVLDQRGVEVFSAKRNAKVLNSAGIANEYQADISTAILRYYFDDNTLTPDLMKNDNKRRDYLLAPANSEALFHKHFHSTYTPTLKKEGFVGNLNFVYPIAATVKGPNDQPREGSRLLMNYGTIDARWWSDKWDDEFGGFPFILINAAGVAFHGPITNYAPLDVWYLRRGYVSHGCHRMDSSDVMELRNILPKNIKDLGKVNLTVLNNFDSTDWNEDGKNEVIDVKFYEIPTSIAVGKGKTVDDMVKPYLVENQMKTFFQTNAFSRKYYRPLTDTINGAVKYKYSKGVLVRDGVHGPLPIARFESQPSRILQYKETGVHLLPFDDNRGSFPPKYFFNN